MTDPYSVLGITSAASESEVKTAYRRLAKKYHPDRPDGNEAQFKRVNEAYDCIKNGTQPQSTNNTHPFDFEDLFAQHFGRSPRNNSLETTFYVDIEDVVNCATKTISIRQNNNTTRDVTIQIPKGITTGLKVRYQGYGENYKQGRPGDLFVTFVINDHPKFKVDEYDVIYPLNITIREAMLGSEKIIETLDKRQLKLHIKAGTQPNTRLRIPEGGLPQRNAPNGNLFVEVKVKIPTLTEQDLDKPIKEIL